MFFVLLCLVSIVLQQMQHTASQRLRFTMVIQSGSKMHAAAVEFGFNTNYISTRVSLACYASQNSHPTLCGTSPCT